MTVDHATQANSSAAHKVTPPRLVVVVLNWNAAADTTRCVQALRGELGEHDEIVVVDNGSRSEERTPVAALQDITLLESDRNLGFAGGTNHGVRHALARDAEWVLWWNNDAIPQPGAITKLLAAAEAQQLDAAQPLLVREDDPQRIDSAGLFALHRGGACDWLRGRDVQCAPDRPTAILGPCGAAALWRASTLRNAGLMDDGLFTLFEDLDQALKIARIGGRSMLVPTAIATHRRGASDPQTDARAGRLRKLWVQRNVTALALRDWPMRSLLAHAPTLFWRATQALWLSRGTDFACLAMWRHALRQRRSCRAQMREHNVERFMLPREPESCR